MRRVRPKSADYLFQGLIWGKASYNVGMDVYDGIHIGPPSRAIQELSNVHDTLSK